MSRIAEWRDDFVQRAARKVQALAAPDDAPRGPETDRSYYLALAELVRRHAPDFAGFPTVGLAELKVASQNGEDGIIAEILRRISHTGPGYFVEFGIESGREGNCVVLADHFGWDGLFIEGDLDDYARLAAKYEPSRVQTMHAMVTPNSVEQLISEAAVPDEPTIVSIDVDGDDYWIWQKLERYRPLVLIIEFNAARPPDAALIQPYGTPREEAGANFGASIEAVRQLGVAKGYALVHTDVTGSNAFCVRSDLAARFGEALVHGPNYHLRARGLGRSDPAASTRP